MVVKEIVSRAFQQGMAQVPAEILPFSEMVSRLQPRNILEIGTARGGTFLIWCALCAAGGKKISVDLPGGRYGGALFEDPGHRMSRDEKIRSWGPNIHLIAGDSHSEETVTQVEAILDGELVDLLFIDGDHTYEGVKRDFELYRGFVSPTGYIAFHDINDSEFHRSQDVDVKTFWKELRGNKLEITAQGTWGGIGVLSAPFEFA